MEIVSPEKTIPWRWMENPPNFFERRYILKLLFSHCYVSFLFFVVHLQMFFFVFNPPPDKKKSTISKGTDCLSTSIFSGDMLFCIPPAPQQKLTCLAGKSPFLIGDTSSKDWVFHCHVSLPGWKQEFIMRFCLQEAQKLWLIFFFGTFLRLTLPPIVVELENGSIQY